ncbi:unnamed protein product [Closterium sp. NIES-53]
MATSPDSSSTIVRRHRPVNTPSPAAARAHPTPHPDMPQSSPAASGSTEDEPSSIADRPRPPLPRVAVPTFPQLNRPQGQVKRNADAEPPSPRHRMTKRVRHSYTVKEKLHWLKMQEFQPDLTNRALAKLAKVQPCQIRDRKKMRERLEVASGCRRRLIGAGRKAKYPFMERAVYRQFLSHRAKGLSVSVNMLQKWSAKYLKHRMPGVNWRASFRWSARFRARWHLARRVKTKMGQKLAADCKEKFESFWEFVRQMRTLHDYPLDLIVNADQAPLFLEMPAERTIEMKGARTVHVRSAGYQKERVTVMLAVTAGGLKLPPYVVFKWKTVPKVAIPAGACAVYEASARDYWTSKGGLGGAGLIPRPPDRSCWSDDAHVQAVEGGHPRGCTPLVQPLDISINRAFKCGNLQKPPTETVLRWIDESWEAVPEELVKKAFVTCGISTSIDGTEDHLILAHMRDKGEVEVLDDVNEMVDDETVINPFYAEVPMPAEELQVEEEDDAAEAEAEDEEGVGPADGEEAGECSDDDDWWRPGHFDGEEVEEWHAGDDDELIAPYCNS